MTTSISTHSSGAAKKLFSARAVRAGARVRCFCFPYAGGSDAMYARWPQLLAPDVDVIPALLPGRGARFADAAYRDFRHLLDDLATAIMPWLDREYLLFGHSLGAIVAFELAVRLQARMCRQPRHLFVSGARAPHSPRPPTARLRPDDHLLDDGELVSKLAELGGMPREYLDDPELLSVVLPTVRADFHVYDSYRPVAAPPSVKLRCPITALGGDGDVAEVPEVALQNWARYTSGTFSARMLPGDHFFVTSRLEEVASIVRAAAGSTRDADAQRRA